ncbi:hypothetical protein [Bradyrhizobium sp. SRS-191]|uniref:hypothetical protein n=1 Tax=Bradyrhizobium sp. SRS-191 TaxID=2962606 RepID=UPI00211DE7DB|nr:hypothetical protein [Bradyrhizobium sp. SRS-191]
MTATTTTAKLTAWAGLVIGGLAWAVNTQLGEMLATTDCISAVRPSAVISAALLAVVLIAAGLSWWRDGRPSTRADRTLPFAARLSALTALLFAFAVVLQAIASVVLSGCER